MAEDDFLRRWSKRKVAARNATQGEAPAVPAASASVPPTASVAASGPSPPSQPEPVSATAAPPALPDPESLTPESDFAPFMARDVDAGMRNRALKALFSDPRFNVMDMMDVYVDDYSKPDPLPESWLAKMEQVSRLGDRAGRDREDEERRRATTMENADSAQGDTRVAAADAGDRAVAAQEPAAPDSGGAPEEAAPDTENPIRKTRESGT